MPSGGQVNFGFNGTWNGPAVFLGSITSGSRSVSGSLILDSPTANAADIKFRQNGVLRFQLVRSSATVLQLGVFDAGEALVDIPFQLPNAAGADISFGGVAGTRLLRATGGLAITTGANKKFGSAVLVAGTVTVANTSITANSQIFVTSQVDGGTPGFLRITAKVVGTSFTITSSNAADTSTVQWMIVES